MVPAVPEPLDALVAKCVEPDPDKRFQTTAELVAALDRLDDNGKLKPKKRAVALPLVSAVALGLLTLSGYIYWVTRPPVQHDPVSVVLADFANTTGDTGFDGTLESMMKVALEGASFMTVYDRAGIRRNLGVTPPEKLDERAAQELAVRQGVGVVLSGSIAPDGRGYRLSIKAVRAATGEIITDLDQRAQDKDRVLATAGDLATDIRQALGDDTSESAQRFAMVTWTANSLDVVHEYAIALQAVSNTDYEQATQSFTKAVTLDPNFGPGYVGLAVVAWAFWTDQHWAVNGVAVAINAILLISIRNEWDLVTWLAPHGDVEAG